MNAPPVARRARVSRRAGVVWTLALSCLTGACATTHAVPRPFPVPDANRAPPSMPTEPVPASPASDPPAPSAFPGAIAATPTGPPSLPGSADSYALVGTALALRGIPYRNGGSDPHGFDCSG